MFLSSMEKRTPPLNALVRLSLATAAIAPRVQLSLENSAQGNGSFSSAVVACGTLSLQRQQWDVYKTYNTAGPVPAVQSR